MSGAGKRRGGRGQTADLNNPPANTQAPTPGYDGPASQPGSIAGSQGPRSPTVQNPGFRGQGGPHMGDPALDRPKLLTDMCRNIDLPPSAYYVDGTVCFYPSDYVSLSDLPLALASSAIVVFSTVVLSIFFSILFVPSLPW